MAGFLYSKLKLFIYVFLTWYINNLCYLTLNPRIQAFLNTFPHSIALELTLYVHGALLTVPIVPLLGISFVAVNLECHLSLVPPRMQVCVRILRVINNVGVWQEFMCVIQASELLAVAFFVYLQSRDTCNKQHSSHRP